MYQDEAKHKSVYYAGVRIISNIMRLSMAKVYLITPVYILHINLIHLIKNIIYINICILKTLL